MAHFQNGTYQIAISDDEFPDGHSGVMVENFKDAIEWLYQALQEYDSNDIIQTEWKELQGSVNWDTDNIYSILTA